MRLPSHTTVIAYVALFASVGTGGAFAATKLSANSVGSREIKPRSVQVSDLARAARPKPAVAAPAPSIDRASLRAAVADVVADPASGINITIHGEKGDPGAPGPVGPGLANVTVREATQAAPAGPGEGSASVECLAGERVIGGGGRFETNGQDASILRFSLPLNGTQGWQVAFFNQSPSSGTAHVYALCAPSA
jgi:hypothetical protein